jgi:nucleotide-binding universal stress UspA family protein
LQECKDRGVGLLVMGAYEHSKFREDLFGGVTNEILQECPVPVLLSH